MRQKIEIRRVAAILFSLIIALLLGLGGLLAGDFLWDRFGSPSGDESATESFGMLLASVFAVGGGVSCLWKFWPSASESPTQTAPVDRRRLDA